MTAAASFARLFAHAPPLETHIQSQEEMIRLTTYCAFLLLTALL